MQFVRGEGAGKEDFPILGELPSKNIDTGMGLERMAALLQGVDNIYEIDTMWRVLDRAAELTEQKYGHEHRTDVALRVVADHVRTAVMLVADGVLPSNEGRGYVLRRILRRSVRNLRLLAGSQRGGSGGSQDRGGHGEHYLHELASSAIDSLGDQYPELRRDAPNIHTVIDAEEAAFLGTLRTGTAIFDAAVEETRRRGSQVMAGGQAFQLHDTYGFPIDLTLEMAAEQGLEVDEGEFRRLMAEQRQRAKADAAGKKTGNADISAFAAVLEKSGPVVFTGYDQVAGEAVVTGLLAGGAGGAGGHRGHRGRRGARPHPVLRRGRRPAGRHRHDHRRTARVVEVLDVQRPVPGLIVHRGRVTPGRDRGRRAGVRGDRHRAAAGHLPLAHRHAPGAPGVPRRARRVGRAGRLGELAGPVPVRLHRRRARCRRRCCATPRTRSTRS